MKRLVLIFLYSFFEVTAFGQNTIPTIKATSSSVDIKVGNDFFIKGGWVLEPHKKTDVFSIGSKWPYEHKRVAFITDIDSISFDVQPGNKYDFIILLNETLPCHIQITTSPNPVFLNSKILIPVAIGFMVMLTLVYWKRNQVSTTMLLKLGYTVVLFFWILVFISGNVHGNYSHVKNVISELGAVGTKSEIITSSSLILLAVFSTLFSIGFYRASKKLMLSSIPATLSFIKPFSLVWIATFPLGNEFHRLIGPLPLLITLASFLSFILWKREKAYFSMRLFSLLSFFVMTLILLRFLPFFGAKYEGLIQRFFYVGWSVWTITISYLLAKQVKILTEKSKIDTNSNSE